VATEFTSRSDEFTLYPIGDIHLGAKACSVGELKRTIEEVRANPRARWIGMGDYAEHITMGDKRFDIRTIDESYLDKLDDLPGACVRDLAELFYPIREKCIGLLVGNHEEKLRLTQSNDVAGALCIALRTKNLGYDSIVRWTFRSKSRTGNRGFSTVIKILASHGTIASRKAGAKINRMDDIASNFNVDIALFGHGHSELSHTRIELDIPSNGEMDLIERKKLTVMTGCYRRNHTVGTLDYGEKAGYAPTPIGSPRIRIRPGAEQPKDRFSMG
jgi:hypothetical protein